MVRERRQCRRPVEVVGVRDSERSVDEGSGRLDRLSGAGNGSLHDRHDRKVRRPEGPYVFEQFALDLLTHDEDDSAEPCGEGVAGRVIHECLTARSNGSKLFQASEAAAVTGREQDELHG